MVQSGRAPSAGQRRADVAHPAPAATGPGAAGGRRRLGGRRLLPACDRGGAGGGATPHFVDDTRASGIAHRYDGEFEYFVGGGVAAFDCDADGRDELFLAGGTQPAALYHNDSPIGGALRFSALPSPVTDLTAVTGAYPIDIDSDGQVDLVVLRRDGDVVLRGLGGCRFAPADQELGLDVPPGWTTAFSATWEGANALPTLAFGRYLVPGEDRCDQSWLVRPESATATRYAAPVALAPGYCTLSMLFSDWGHTGERDLRVSNDRHYYLDGEEQLWRIAGRPAAHAATPRPTAGNRSRSGAWGSPARTSRATGARRCSSRARPTTSCRRWPPARPVRPSRTSRSAAGSRRNGPTSAATCCPRRRGTRSSPTSTTTACPTCS